MKRGFTLLEIIMVSVIIGVLATLGISHYTTVREMALDKEAVANLRLIFAAERIYRMETGDYYDTGRSYPPQPDAIISLNNNLKLSLPAGDNRAWNYAVTPDCPTGTCFCMDARRFTDTNVEGSSWYLRPSDGDEPDRGKCHYN